MIAVVIYALEFYMDVYSEKISVLTKNGNSQTLHL